MVSGIERLSPRECDVAALLAQGLANKQIADSLGISQSRVKDVVEDILKKLGAPNRAAAAALWAQWASK
ncbi:MAG: helix-turn-helix transcriptional regulator [Thermoflexaceae bacterium]|nr:helix-turn-helix transcriptional regulator [Thermoflexaceae bacterium]